MTSTIKLTDKQTTILDFTHLATGKPASLAVACNPLTGDWIETHTTEAGSTAYKSSKADALKLVRRVMLASDKAGLPCKVRYVVNVMA
jgi:hypothetical protein